MRDEEAGNYLIVGGTSGIGRATVTHVALQRHSNVVFCGRNAEAGIALQEALRKETDKIICFVQADVEDAGAVARLFEAVRDLLPRLDGAFNASGVVGTDSPHRGGRFHTSLESDFDRVWAVNVKGIWRCLRHELAIMSAQRHGSIVNCASVAGLRAADSRSVSYTASKHALVGMTRALAVEYAGDGIRLNAVCPGVIATGMLRGMEEALLADLRGKNPHARLGTADEVAEAVEFLLSGRSSYISGTTLTVDAGGLHGAL